MLSLLIRNARFLIFFNKYWLFIFTDGMFWDIEKFLISRHHAGLASENKHAAVGFENRRSRRPVASIEFLEHESVAKHVGISVFFGNYCGPILKLNENKIFKRLLLLQYYVIRF